MTEAVQFVSRRRFKTHLGCHVEQDRTYDTRSGLTHESTTLSCPLELRERVVGTETLYEYRSQR